MWILLFGVRHLSMFRDTGNGSRSYFLPKCETLIDMKKQKSPHQMRRGKESPRIFQQN